MRESFYRTTFSRHIHSVLINGFMARELDADDHEFLEQVRVSGIANGSLPNTSIASVEELDFWQLPYDVAPDVERRAGPVPKPIATPEQHAARLARTNAWHARRVIREQERAIAAAELERERQAWAAANEKRRAQEIMTEAEWQTADPFRATRARKPKFGATIDRHYVPQWKLDEQIDAAVAKAETKRAAAREAKAAKQAVHAAEADRLRREAVIAEARRVLREPIYNAPPTPAYTIDSLKQAIMTLGRSMPGKVWLEDEMQRALGCERSMMDDCLRRLVSDGRLRITAPTT
jgi:hypothetical protein